MATSLSWVMGTAVGLGDDFGIFLDATAFGAVAACFEVAVQTMQTRPPHSRASPGKKIRAHLRGWLHVPWRRRVGGPSWRCPPR